MRAIARRSRAGKISSREARNRLWIKKARGGACLSVFRYAGFVVCRVGRGAERRAHAVYSRPNRVGFASLSTTLQKRRKRNAGKRRVTTAASCDAARALSERARLTAFHRGSHPREYLIPKARLQARLPGTWSERVLPAFACPSPGMHLPPRSSCREADTQAAREQPAKPPAGTALAPMTRCASAPCPSKERGL
jgi:hypothetical protein